MRAEYLVVSLPSNGGAVGFSATQAWNQRSLDPHTRFKPGQTVSATVAALPSSETGMSLHRCLLCVRLCEKGALKDFSVALKPKHLGFLSAMLVAQTGEIGLLWDKSAWPMLLQLRRVNFRIELVLVPCLQTGPS